MLDAVHPMGLFYTGHMVLGERWGMQARERASKWLGSACVLYRVSPRQESLDGPGEDDGTR